MFRFLAPSWLKSYKWIQINQRCLDAVNNSISSKYQWEDDTLSCLQFQRGIYSSKGETFEIAR